MNPILYVGPMSKNVVDAVIELNADVGFCVSRRQVEYNDGYVNNWITNSFVEYVKSRLPTIVLVRDHGGPGQGIVMDDGVDSFKYDAALMDIIHIDPWKKYKSMDMAITKTIEYIRLCYKINNNCLYEVSTEQSIRKISVDELYFFMKSLKNHLSKEMFRKIRYVVIQSGTDLKEDRNIGEYDEVKLKKMLEICDEFFVLSKEHNGDYISSDIIKSKFVLGLSSINIAPEFGVIETTCILNRITEVELFDDLFDVCYKSGKWKKWVDNNFDPFLNKKQLIKICGHYVFSTKQFKKIKALDFLFNGIDHEIKTKIKKRIDSIIN